MEPLNMSISWVPKGLKLLAFPFFNNDVAIFAIIDIVLGMVFFVLLEVYMETHKKLTQSQRGLAQFKMKPPSPFSNILESVNRTISKGLLREAVLTEFPKILDIAIRIDGAKIDASFTTYEVISHGLTEIHQEVKEALMTLYHIYEPVRFGNASPPPEEGLKFLEVLRRLVESERMYA